MHHECLRLYISIVCPSIFLIEWSYTNTRCR